MNTTIDVPRLFALWADTSLNRDDIARLLGIGGTTLQKAIHRYKLPARDIPKARRSQRADPTPAEIAELKAAIRRRNMQALLDETPEQTERRVATQERRPAWAV